MKYLAKDDFFKKYFEVYEGLSKSFFKLETLQEYNEYGITDWDAVESSTMLKIIKEAQANVAKSKDRYKKVIDKGVTLKRIRYLSFPLSKYVLRQFSSYIISEEIGEKIYIIDGKSQFEDIDDYYFTDFIILDNKFLFVHKYVNGDLEGAFYSEDESDILPYKKVKDQLSKIAVPFTSFLSNYNISFKKNIE